MHVYMPSENISIIISWVNMHLPVKKVKIHSSGLIKMRMNEYYFFSFAEHALHCMTRQNSLLIKAAATNVTKTS